MKYFLGFEKCKLLHKIQADIGLASRYLILCKPAELDVFCVVFQNIK